MSTFQLSVVSPERLLFEGRSIRWTCLVPRVILLAGHMPITAMLRPEIVTAIVGSVREKFVVFGGITEFSKETLET